MVTQADDGKEEEDEQHCSHGDDDYHKGEDEEPFIFRETALKREEKGEGEKRGREEERKKGGRGEKGTEERRERGRVGGGREGGRERGSKTRKERNTHTH